MDYVSMLKTYSILVVDSWAKISNDGIFVWSEIAIQKLNPTLICKKFLEGYGDHSSQGLFKVILKAIMANFAWKPYLGFNY